MEYKNTPHQRGITRVGFIVIAALIAIAVLLVAWQWARDDATNGNPPQAANKEAIQNARCDYTDTDLCKFFAVQKATKHYSLAATQESGGQKSAITLKRESDTKYHLKITGANSKEIISINSTLYTKSADGSWLRQTMPTAEANKITETIHTRLPEATKDADPTRTTYKKISTERCGSAECFKYQVVNPAAPKTTAFIWFDTTDYNLRRMQTTAENRTQNTTYDYAAVTIAAPSPAKDAPGNAAAATVQGQTTTLPKTGDD